MGSPNAPQATTRRKQDTHLHEDGARLSITLTTRSDYVSFRGAETFRNQQEVPQEVPRTIQQKILQENSEKHPDNMFKVITTETNLRTLNLMEQDIKKLILGDCEVTDAGCQVIADIVKVNDPIGLSG